MAKPRGPPSQGWKTLLRNHADGIAAIDLFVVPYLRPDGKIFDAFAVIRKTIRDMKMVGIAARC